MLLRQLLLPSIIMTSMIANQAMADGGLSSAYAFSGGCASQGTWTQQALSSTQSLRKITLQLKDDPNCKSLGTSVQNAITSLEVSVKEAADSPQRAVRLSQIPGEVNALRSFLNSNNDMKEDVLRLMMDRSIEGATLAAQVSTQANTLSTEEDAKGKMASSILDFGARFQNSTRTGLNLLNQVIDAVPQLNQCLAGDSGQGLGNYIAMSVKIVSAFASAGEDNSGGLLANTISKITNLLREDKYTKILRTLNQQEFLTSVSCLMEVSSESYCQARDAMGLFKKSMDDLKIRKNGTQGLSADNPFTGYYVLNTHVPNITKWLQKIQIGVDPKLPTDATFQNKIQQEVTEFYKDVKILLGYYNSQAITIRALPSLQAKQNAVLRMLFTINDKMVMTNDNFTNFFTMSVNSLNIPFTLFGMNVVPDPVSGRSMPMMSYDQWLNANYQTLPAFQDPDALVLTIGHNMQEIIRDANTAAIEYFNRWYIVDKAALVNESTTNVNYTIKDSLIAIQKYLEEAKGRIVKYDGDPSSLPTMVDTQVRIKNILSGYGEIAALGKKFAAMKAPTVTVNATKEQREAEFKKMMDSISVSTEELQKNAAVYEKLINTVYEQFNVMQSRSGFLANRMVNFVYADYILLLKSKADFTEYQQELFYATGMAAFDRMLQVNNGNPANIQTDLNMALRVNAGNLDALQALIKDETIAMIAQQNAIQKDDSLAESSIKGSIRNIKDTVASEIRNSRWYDQPALMPTNTISLMMWNIRFALNAMKHKIRYFSATDSNQSSPETEFQDAQAVKAQLCIQALAFNDQTGITSACSGTVLKSPFKDAGDKYDTSYDKKLVSHFSDKGASQQMRVSLNHSERVCAFRDYNRTNMVLFMSVTKGK
jgi:hypothetical protein